MSSQKSPSRVRKERMGIARGRRVDSIPVKRSARRMAVGYAHAASFISAVIVSHATAIC